MKGKSNIEMVKYLGMRQLHASVSKSRQSMAQMGDGHRNGGRVHGHDHDRDLKTEEVALLAFSLIKVPMVVCQRFVACHLMAGRGYHYPYFYHRSHHSHLAEHFPVHYPVVDLVWELQAPDRLGNLLVQTVVADSLKSKLAFLCHRVAGMMHQHLAETHTNLWAGCNLHQTMMVSDY